MSSFDQTVDYITCNCGSPGHLLTMEMIEWKREGKVVEIDTSVYINLNPNISIWQRIWYAVKYIFAHRNSSDGFEEIIIGDENLERVINFLTKVKTIKQNIKNNV